MSNIDPLYKVNKGEDHDELINTCNSTKQLDAMKAYWPLYGSILDTNKIFKKYLKPCNNFHQLIFNTDTR